MFCEGILIVGVRMPSANPITKLIVTKFIVTTFMVTKSITKPFSGVSHSLKENPLLANGRGLAFKQIEFEGVC